MKMWQTLNDASILCPELSPGTTEIWYAKTLKAPWDEPAKLTTDSHVLLGSIAETDLEAIFRALQGENWSPDGQARDLIRGKGLSHTSMSVGDVVKIGGRAWMVAFEGFAEIPEE